MGRISFDPPDQQQTFPPLATAVFRHDGTGNYKWLPNVRITSLTHSENAQPSTARFRYILDDGNPNIPWPDQFEDLFPINASGPWVVRQDDRLAVWGMDGDGQQAILFDGFAQIPEIGLDPESQRVSFAALGVEYRLWDNPAEGACYRDSDDTADGDPVVTQLPVRFNPNDKDNRSQPNATAAGQDAGGLQNVTGAYPLFLDYRITRNPDPRRFWTLGMFVRYMLWRNNPDQQYVFNGDTSNLDNLLTSVVITTDILGPVTKFSPITLPEYDVGNEPAIVAINDLCSRYGFGVVFRIQTQSNNVPQTSIRFYRKDNADSSIVPKVVYLDDPGDLDPATSNVSAMSLDRDSRRIVNSFQAETAPLRYEISVVLAPGFIPVAGDEADGTRNQWIEANWTLATPQSQQDMYRKYIFDECGDGHWDRFGKQWSMTAGDLSAVLNVDAAGNPAGPGQRYYAKLYRPARNNLITKAPGNQPQRFQLAISRDYKGQSPAIWDGTGTWQPITGGFESLDDQLGIRINCPDPEQWDIGKYTGNNPATQNSGSDVRAVTSAANPYPTASDKASPNAANTQALTLIRGRFFLRLTCVIEGDFGISATAAKRPTTPTQFTITNKVDTRDNYLKETVDKSSAAGKGQGVIRDDTTLAQAYTAAWRAVYETAPGRGQIVIPFFTDSYRVGDQIRAIYGRDCSLQSNIANPTTPAQFPTVTGITWDFEDGQRTTLSLTEHRINPPPLR